MLSKTLLVLAASSLVQDVLALGHRQHGHQVMHQKRAVVTEVVTKTAYVYVTLGEAEATSSSAVSAKKFYTRKRPARLSKTTTAAAESTAAPSAASAVAESFPRPSAPADRPGVPAPAPSAEAPATPPSPVSPPAAEPAPVNPPAAEPAPANPPASDPAPATPPSGGSGSGARGRGLPYNDPNVLGRFLNGGSHISWTYNWGQTDDSKTGLDFVPMCWGTTKGFPATWPANAQKMIDAGAKALFSFNEPDHVGQANLSPQQAAASHIELMNPFAGKARIGTPSITNGGGNMGINWLKQWFDACAGKCAADFVNIHIYGVDTNTFLQHTLNVYNQFKKPVWITEFALDGSEDQINSQLEVIIDQFEHNSTFSFIERYAYFMAADGYLVKGSSMSKYGNTFAYAS